MVDLSRLIRFETGENAELSGEDNIILSEEKIMQQDFNAFLKFFNIKRTLSKQLTEKNFKQHIPEMTNINNKMIALLRKLEVHSVKEKDLVCGKLVKLLQSHPMFRKVFDSVGKEQEIMELQKYLVAVLNYKKNLYQTLLKQQQLLKVLKEKKAYSAKDEDYLAFLHTEDSERAAERNILTFLAQAVKKTKQLEKEFSTSASKKKAKDSARIFDMKDVRFAEILNNGAHFSGFYNLYKKAFPAEERENKQILTEGIAGRYSADGVDCSNHIIGAFYKGECIGGIYFVLIKHAKFSFGMIWWTVVAPEYRGYVVQNTSGNPLFKVGQKLVDLAEKKLQSLAALNRVNLFGNFIELNNPLRMTKTEISAEVMNPLFRINFWEGKGYRNCFDQYIQLMEYDHGIPIEKQTIATYCNLCVKPIGFRWRFHIPKEDLRQVIFAIATISCSWPKERLMDFSHYRNMMSAINKSMKHQLTEFNKEEVAAVVGTVKKFKLAA
ncbi:MAG: hypothetical protein Q8O89_02655 [Nanoarchaeota archaeon]|nr:hypothetical protein [Nanoarchaeota archaeon]